MRPRRLHLRHLIFLIVAQAATAVWGQPAPATPGSSPSRAASDLNAESRALVERLVADRAAAIVVVQRKADEREERLWADLAAKDRRLRSEIHSRAAAQAELAGKRAELTQVMAQRLRLVDELAARDRQFAAEIGEYRKQVASIAGSPDPRKRDALARYAEGDRAGGFGALVRPPSLWRASPPGGGQVECSFMTRLLAPTSAGCCCRYASTPCRRSVSARSRPSTWWAGAARPGTRVSETSSPRRRRSLPAVRGHGPRRPAGEGGSLQPPAALRCSP